MKFAHMADCHIGAWRDGKMKDLNTSAFLEAIDIALEEKVDFIVIAGDLFNTALPGIDKLKEVVRTFRMLNDREIPVYLIPGSHDFSPSGKTMLDVLEEAGLCVNVVKGKVEDKTLELLFTRDKKTGVKITGMLGRRGMLERSYYEKLNRKKLEEEPGKKIFLFHTALTELKPKRLEKMDSSPVSLLPKGFEYYAGGHVHIVEQKELPGYRNVIYPGPLFPNSFSELWDLKKGGLYIYDDGSIIRKDIEMKPVHTIEIDASHKIPEQITEELLHHAKIDDVKDAIVLIRVHGRLESGKISEIKFNQNYAIMYNRGAYFIMRNTAKLTSREFEEVKVRQMSADQLEKELIEEHAGQFDVWEKEKEKQVIVQLMHTLSQDRQDGEKVYEYEDRIKDELSELLLK